MSIEKRTSSSPADDLQRLEQLEELPTFDRDKEIVERSTSTLRIKGGKLSVLAALIVSILYTGELKSMEEKSTNRSKAHIDQKRLEFAKETIRLYGNMISTSAQRGILEQKILIGMSPYEAKLAGGAFHYKVEADPKVWPSGANPIVLMDRQSFHPDESKIWMSFQNDTQFSGEGEQRFTVFITNGRVQTIEKLSDKKSTEKKR